MALTNNFTDDTSAATVHAAAHNAVADAVNGLSFTPMPTPTLDVGRYYDGSVNATAYGTKGLGTDFVYVCPFTPARSITVDRIQFNITTGTTGAVRLGIYESHINTGLPDALLVDGGTLTISSIGLKEVTISQNLVQGKRYWLALHSNTTVTVNALPLASSPQLGLAAAATTQASGFDLIRSYVSGFQNPAGAVSYRTGANSFVSLRVRVAAFL